MTRLTLTLIRVAFLAVLWLFVIAAIGVVRTDLLGTVASKVRRVGNQPAPMSSQATAVRRSLAADARFLVSPRAA